jgi:(1->4)-alpha-D-glucan 1-alpha-D-glucosylmutase
VSLPVATYRLQLGPGFTFDAARERVPYLRDLGVSHLYLSPVMQARTGSTHGYDVVDPTVVSSVLGGEERLRTLAAAGLAVVIDIVPNHMAASDENPFWRDPVLRSKFFDLDPHGGHRRFFDVDDLAGVRMEDPDVFAATHRKVIELVHDGVVAAVRVDHVDGLADPAAYLERLRGAGIPLVWVEKIVEAGEQLPPWPVAGTTGYEFLVDADALFVDPDGKAVLDGLAGFDDDRARTHGFADMSAAAKIEQVATTFQPEVARLRRVADLPALEPALAALPVYRTYIDPTRGEASPADRRAIAALPDNVAAALLGSESVPREFVVRFQQTTGAVMAKGVEDTAMYRHARLLALNEVGGQPDRFGLSVTAFHAGNLERLRRWPANLLAATTHDTKRNADVRARIGALAAMAPVWRERVVEWRDLLAQHRVNAAPDATEELFVFQTLVGAWPISPDRLRAYLVKALREAKRNTSWTDPDERWENGAIDATLALLDDERFTRSFLPFVDALREAGEIASIGQTVLRCTSPGVPDVYQGDELWNLALVDPDNRRPVDWDTRLAALELLRNGATPSRNLAKLFTLYTMLGLRRRHDSFAEAAYAAIDVDASVCAFARGDDVIVAVPVRRGTAAPTIESLGYAGGWTDLLVPLSAAYGDRRPAVYERTRR